MYSSIRELFCCDYMNSFEAICLFKSIRACSTGRRAHNVRQLIIHKVTQSSAHGQYIMRCGLVHLSKMGKTSRAEWVILLVHIISAGLFDKGCFFSIDFVECHAWKFHDYIVLMLLLACSCFFIQ